MPLCTPHSYFSNYIRTGRQRNRWGQFQALEPSDCCFPNKKGTQDFNILWISKSETSNNITQTHKEIKAWMVMHGMLYPFLHQAWVLLDFLGNLCIQLRKECYYAVIACYYLQCHLQTKSTNMLRQRRANSTLKWVMGVESRMGLVPAVPCREEMA